MKTFTHAASIAALSLAGPVAAPVRAQPVEDPGEFEATVAVLAPEVAKALPAPPFKAEPASIYAEPYLADDTKWEKAARTTWYSGQIPAGFPASGTVEVLYLPRCAPPAFNIAWLNDGEWTAAMRSAAEIALVRQALVAKGLDAASAMQATPAAFALRSTSSYGRETPDPALKSLNAALQSAFEAGRIGQRIAVFEPFCPSTQRGTYAQDIEQYQARVARWRASDGPVPPPPPPPPPPPAYYAAAIPPIGFVLPAGAKVWIASELKARICEMRTKKAYQPACGGQQLFGTAMSLTGTRYRYYMERPGQAPRQGSLDLNVLPKPIDLKN